MYSLCLVVLIAAFTVNACPTINSRASWGATNPKNVKTISKPVSYVIVHHTTGGTCNGLTQCAAKLQGIQQYHKTKWSDIGYNFLIDSGGNIYEGRGWGQAGAHAPNYNSDSVGVAVIGDYTNEQPGEKVTGAIAALINCGLTKNSIASTYKLLGHRQTKSTECPGNKLYAKVQAMPHWASKP